MSARHGGEVQLALTRLGRNRQEVLDASASLAPWTPRLRIERAALRDYPDRLHTTLRQSIARIHGLDSDQVLPGNGAAELFTWAARDAAQHGCSELLAPGFADYQRALDCWDAKWHSNPLPLSFAGAFPQPFPSLIASDVLWVCNPHNPTGQLWSGASLEPLLSRYSLVICDEAFLSLVPDGESQSLIPLLAQHPNLVVIRSLTKLFGLAGVRLGYALGDPERLQRWARWRDPWPVNGVALAMGQQLLSNPRRYQRWCERVQRWVAQEGRWLHQQLTLLPELTPMPSAANYLLIQGEGSLVPLRERVEQRDLVLLRDCRSFAGLGERWLRIGLQDRRGNQRILSALQRAQANSPWSRATSF